MDIPSPHQAFRDLCPCDVTETALLYLRLERLTIKTRCQVEPAEGTLLIVEWGELIETTLSAGQREGIIRRYQRGDIILPVALGKLSASKRTSVLVLHRRWENELPALVDELREMQADLVAELKRDLITARKDSLEERVMRHPNVRDAHPSSTLIAADIGCSREHAFRVIQRVRESMGL